MTLIKAMQGIGARLCHDLAAPLGALSIGIEMLTEAIHTGKPEAQLQIINLLNFSMQAAIAKLEIYRCLMGYTDHLEKPGLEEIQKSCHAYWAPGNIKPDWQVSERCQGLKARLLLGLGLLAEEGLLQGGRITFHNALTVVAEGAGAGDHASKLDQYLDYTTDQVPPRKIVNYFISLMAQAQGLKIQAQEATPEKIILRAVQYG